MQRKNQPCHRMKKCPGTAGSILPVCRILSAAPGAGCGKARFRVFLWPELKEDRGPYGVYSSEVAGIRYAADTVPVEKAIGSF